MKKNTNYNNEERKAHSARRDKKQFPRKQSSRAAKTRKEYSDDSGTSTDRICVSKPNDQSWYTLNSQLLTDTASFPYAWPLGRSLNLNPYGADMNKGSLPGIMTLQWTPTIGNASDATSAVNVASINTYTKIRHDNSGHANYDHQDYMMYLLAMDSVYSFHSWMRRVYGVALTYSNVNRYYPSAILKAMGVSFANIQKNLANFRAYINEYAIKASALAVPAKMSFMTKHYWMNEGLYLDTNQDKPQTYVLQPTGFYKFTTDEHSAGKLSFTPLFGSIDAPGVTGKHIPQSASNAELTVDSIIAFGDALLDPIIADEDFGIMSGDTLKSFQPSGCYTLPITDEKYTVIPVYNEEVLDQIQNATLIGDIIIEDAAITQDSSIGTGAILAHPTFAHPWVATTMRASTELPGQNAFLTDRIVTFNHGDVTPGNTMEATRWTNIGTQVTETDTRSYYVPTLGSEAINNAFITYFAQPGSAAAGQLVPMCSSLIYVSMNIEAPFGDFNLDAPSGDTPTYITAEAMTALLKRINTSAVTAMQKQFLVIQQLGMFNRHPAVALTSFADLKVSILYDGNPVHANEHEYGVLNGYLYDVNYYTILNARDLESMSHIALLSEFDVTVR